MHIDSYFFNPSFLTLFQTRAWINAWKDIWAEQVQRYSFVDSDHPAYLINSATKLKGIIPIHSATPYGCMCETIPSIRSEFWNYSTYLHEDAGISFKEWLSRALSTNSNQLILPDVIINSHIHKETRQIAETKNHLVLECNPSIAYSVNTQEGSFSDYLSTLSSNTRPKLYNRRKRLNENNDVAISDWTGSNSEFIDLLNHFHMDRWGKPCFEGKNRDFIENLLPRLEEEGHKVIRSTMYKNSSPISILLDIQVGPRIYNLQAGYIENLIKGVALGTIHLGYQIESSFNNPEIIAYDFMAGTGKNENYKEKIANQYVTLSDLVIIKPWWLKLLYRLNEKKNARH